MDVERVLGLILFLSGIFLLGVAAVTYLGGLSSGGVSISGAFLVDVLIGIFLAGFGLYLLQIVRKEF